MNTDSHDPSSASEGPRQAFMEEARPYLDELIESARHHLAYHEACGDLPEGLLTPQEVAGETLIRAFACRDRRPREVETRDWLLGLEARTLDLLMLEDSRDRELWAVSLDQPLPVDNPMDLDDSFWDWYQPDAEETLGDTIAARPVDAAEAAERGASLLAQATELPREEWRAWLLSELHRLDTQSVASAMKRSFERVTVLVEQAHARIAVSRSE